MLLDTKTRIQSTRRTGAQWNSAARLTSRRVERLQHMRSTTRGLLPSDCPTPNPHHGIQLSGPTTTPPSVFCQRQFATHPGSKHDSRSRQTNSKAHAQKLKTEGGLFGVFSCCPKSVESVVLFNANVVCRPAPSIKTQMFDRVFRQNSGKPWIRGSDVQTRVRFSNQFSHLECYFSPPPPPPSSEHNNGAF